MEYKQVKHLYESLEEKHRAARAVLGSPLTLTEKILWSHLTQSATTPLQRGKSFVLLHPDRVAMQDATAQMALLQFIQTGRKTVAVPATVHCDHLILAASGPKADLETAEAANREVYDFLYTASRKYGIGFWKPGSGIIHQIVLENYAFPGGLMIGTDSHTPNAGGLGMAAVGVGGADAVDVMVGRPWELLYPRIIGVKLTGKPGGWVSGKDIILKLLEILSVKGGTNCVMEYFGPGLDSLSCTTQATIANMGAELGATFSVFQLHGAMVNYLKAMRRDNIATLAEKHQACLCQDPETAIHPEKYFDSVIELDLNTLEPYITGPHSPDTSRPVSAMPGVVKSQGYPAEISAGLIGSCTNSSYEDLGRAAAIARQALNHGRQIQIEFLVTPGSSQTSRTAERDGYLEALEQAGAKLTAFACGPCIGQWRRSNATAGKPNSILTSFNRNFPARNDGNPQTHAFIASPEIVTALALAGRLDFNPLQDCLTDSQGNSFKLEAPAAPALPEAGYVLDDSGFVPPAQNGMKINVSIRPGSERLQLLTPFQEWDGEDFIELLLLAKAQGRCTTDHISPAGQWLRFRGHLDNISQNMLKGAINAFSGQAGIGRDLLDNRNDVPFADIARHYKSEGKGWVIVGDENYGEGSSREHAAMTPRYLGGRAVITKSIARIHETNLKKQGLLPLCFKKSSDYDKVQEHDRISITGLKKLTPGKPLKMTLHHQDAQAEVFEVVHSLNSEQIEWFQKGSALNSV